LYHTQYIPYGPGVDIKKIKETLEEELEKQKTSSAASGKEFKPFFGWTTSLGDVLGPFAKKELKLQW
jgi:hypothetical protein